MTTVVGPVSRLALSTRTVTCEDGPLPGELFDRTPAADTPVWVYAYGKWREGVVTYQRPTKVMVEYVCNRRGKTAERSFPTSKVLRRAGTL